MIVSVLLVLGWGLGSALIAENTSGVVREVKVGVAVDYGRLAGKMGLSSIQMALSHWYASNGTQYKTRLIIHPRDTNSDVIGAASAGQFYFLFHYIYFRHRPSQKLTS